MSAKEIANIVQPILSNHLVENVYNRLYPVVQFLDFFEKKREHNSELSPLFALKEFDTKSIVFSDQHNGSCFTLINNFVKNIPTYLSPHLVSAKMSRRFQQKGWHKYSHVAVVIHYEDPINPKDHGVILLDPNFDIPVPLVFNEKNREISIDMGPKRGKWHFVYDGSMIICQSDEEKLSSVGGNVDQMEFYVTHSVADAYSFAFKPLIAADKTLSIVSRDKSGRHTAHLKLNLEKQTIVRSVDGNYLPIQAFDEFLKTPFDKTFCEKLRLPRDGLNAAVKKIILHLDTLAKLRKEFFNNTDVFGKI
jgi:hypothetical protein